MKITQHARRTAFFRLLRDLGILGFHHRIAVNDLRRAWSVRSGLRMSAFHDTLTELRRRGEAVCSDGVETAMFNLTDRGVIQAELVLYPWRIAWPNPIERLTTQLHTQHVLSQVRRRHRRQANGRPNDGQLFERRSSRQE